MMGPELLACSHTNWKVKWKFPLFHILIRNKDNNSEDYNKLQNLLFNDAEKKSFILLFIGLYAIHEFTVKPENSEIGRRLSDSSYEIK